jgi:crotonobetainyl-CoA:carnitine CoA-transferase CaiB-like acyl-CoA transferase
MGRPAWALDRRFETTAGRAAHAGEIDAALAEWTRTMDRHVATSRLQAHGVPAGFVRGCQRSMRGRSGARGARAFRRRPDARRAYRARSTARRSFCPTRPASVRGHGPLLGEHGADVLADVLGWEATAIDELRRDGVLV